MPTLTKKSKPEKLWVDKNVLVLIPDDQIIHFETTRDGGIN